MSSDSSVMKRIKRLKVTQPPPTHTLSYRTSVERLQFLEHKSLYFSWLTTAVKFATHNVRVGCWNKTELKAYLNTCAVNEKVIDDIWSKHKPNTDVPDTSCSSNCSGVIPMIWIGCVSMVA
ncbi:LOW QUALITY PROTEIN: hypothetical protein ACHAWF_002244 [Thalassiosira exigua]